MLNPSGKRGYTNVAARRSINWETSYVKNPTYENLSSRQKPRVQHLEAEERNREDDIVFPGGADGGQNRGHVVNTDTEEEEEAQQMTPDIHRLIGQDEEAAHKMKTFHVIRQ